MQKEVHATHISDKSKLQRILPAPLSHLLPEEKPLRQYVHANVDMLVGMILYVNSFALESLGRPGASASGASL